MSVNNAVLPKSWPGNLHCRQHQWTARYWSGLTIVLRLTERMDKDEKGTTAAFHNFGAPLTRRTLMPSLCSDMPEVRRGAGSIGLCRNEIYMADGPGRP